MPERVDRRLFELQAQLCKVMANEKRLEIIHLLEGGEMTVSDLAREMEVTVANVSQHLALLKQAGVVESRQQGTSIYYRISFPAVTEACTKIRQVLMVKLERDARALQ